MAMEAPGEQLNAQALELQLYNAARNDVIDQVRAVLDQGVNINASVNGFTALRIASLRGNLAVVKLLLNAGATVGAASVNGRTALSFASHNGHLDVVKLLLNAGATVDAASNGGMTALSFASHNGHLDVVKLLVARGADINHRDGDQDTPLLMAAFRDRLPACEFLLRQGADLTAANDQGETAMSHYGEHIHEPVSPLSAETRAALNAAHTDYLLSSLRSTVEGLESRNAVLERTARTTAVMLFSEAFSDLVFVCPGGERIHAHRNIVAAASTPMSALLGGAWAENGSAGQGAQVVVPQSAPAVRALLRFLYTGEVDAAAMETSMSDVLELASQHEQPALKAACEQHVIAALSVQTVVPLLVAAHLHDLAALTARCVALVKANMAAVTLSSSFINLKTSHPLLWREMRAALGLPEEEEEEEEREEDEGEEARNQKRARLCNK